MGSSKLQKGKGLFRDSYNKNSALPGGKSSLRKSNVTNENSDNIVYTIDPKSNFIINDIALNIPPTNINISKEDVYWNWKTLRSSKSTKVPSGQGFCQVTVNIIFTPDLLLHLHRLIVEIRNSPFISVQNNFIKDAIDPSLSPEKGDNIFQQMAFVVTNFHINEAAGLPGTFIVKLDMKWFNYLPYTPNYLYKKDYYTLPISSGASWIQRTIPVVIGPELKRGYMDMQIDKKHYKNYPHLRYKDFNSLLDASTNNMSLENSLNNFSGVLMDGMELPDNMSPSVATFAYHSNIYKRYINDLQFEALFSDFGIDVFSEYHPEWGVEEAEANSKGPEYSNSYLKFTKGHRTSSSVDNDNFLWYQVQSFHLEDSSIVNSILSKMHSHHASFELNYRGFVRLNMPPFVERCKRKYLQAEFLKEVKIVPLSSYAFPNNRQLNLKGMYKTGKVNGHSYGREYVNSKDVSKIWNFGTKTSPEDYSFTGYGQNILTIQEYEDSGGTLYPPLGSLIDKKATAVITDGYGIRPIHPVSKKKNRPHKGIDLAVKKEAYMSYEDLKKVLKGEKVSGTTSKARGQIRSFKDKFETFIADSSKPFATDDHKSALRTIQGKGVAPIFAVEDAVVEFVKNNASGYGFYTELSSSDTTGGGEVFYHKYAHLAFIAVERGQQVKKGDIIGFMGNTGGSKGEHLHFEIRVFAAGGKKALPPYPLLMHKFSKEESKPEGPSKIGLKTDVEAYANNFQMKKDIDIKSLTKDENLIFKTYINKMIKLSELGFQPYLRGGSPGNILYKNEYLPLTNLSSILDSNEDAALMQEMFEFQKGLQADPSILNYENIRKEIYHKLGSKKVHQEVFVTSCSASFSNIVASIPIVGYEFPTTQHMGSMEPGYAFEIQSFDSGLSDNGLDSMSLPMKHLHSVLNRLQKQARDFREAPDSHAFSLNTFLTRLLGSFKAVDMSFTLNEDNEFDASTRVDITPRVVVNRSQVSNVEGFPGRYLMLMELSETNPFQVEQLQVVKERKSLIKKDIEYSDVLLAIKKASYEGLKDEAKKALVINYLKEFKGKWENGEYSVLEYDLDTKDFIEKSYSPARLSADASAPQVSYNGYLMPDSDKVLQIAQSRFGEEVINMIGEDEFEGIVKQYYNAGEEIETIDGGFFSYLEEEDFREFYDDYPWFKDREALTGENTINELIYFIQLLGTIESKIRHTIAEESAGGISKKVAYETLYDLNKWSINSSDVSGEESEVEGYYLNASPSLWRNYIYYNYNFLKEKVVGDGVFDSLNGALGWTKGDLERFQQSIDYGVLYDEYDNLEEEYEKIASVFFFNLVTGPADGSAPEISEIETPVDLVEYFKASNSGSDSALKASFYYELNRALSTTFLLAIGSSGNIELSSSEVIRLVSSGLNDEYQRLGIKTDASIEIKQEDLINLNIDTNGLPNNADKKQQEELAIIYNFRKQIIGNDTMPFYIDRDGNRVLADGNNFRNDFLACRALAERAWNAAVEAGLYNDAVRSQLTKDLYIRAQDLLNEILYDYISKENNLSEDPILQNISKPGAYREEAADGGWAQGFLFKEIPIVETQGITEIHKKARGIVNKNTLVYSRGGHSMYTPLHPVDQLLHDYMKIELQGGIPVFGPSFIADHLLGETEELSHNFNISEQLYLRLDKGIEHVTPGPTAIWNVHPEDEKAINTFLSSNVQRLGNFETTSGSMGWGGAMNTGLNSLFWEDQGSAFDGTTVTQLTLRALAFKDARDQVHGKYINYLDTINLAKVGGMDLLENNFTLLKSYAYMKFSKDAYKDAPPKIQKFIMFKQLESYFEQYSEWFLEPRIINEFGLDDLRSGFNVGLNSIERGFGGMFQTTAHGEYNPDKLDYSASNGAAIAKGVGGGLLVYDVARSLKTGKDVARLTPYGLIGSGIEVGTEAVFRSAHYGSQSIKVDGLSLKTGNPTSTGIYTKEFDLFGNPTGKLSAETLNKLAATSMLINRSNSALSKYYSTKAEELMTRLHSNFKSDVDDKGNLKIESMLGTDVKYLSETANESRYAKGAALSNNFRFRDIRTDLEVLKEINLSNYINADDELKKLEAFRNELKSFVEEVKKNREVCYALGIDFLNESYNYVPPSERYSGIECYPDLGLPNHPFYTQSNFETGAAFYMWDIYNDGGAKITKEFLDEIERNSKVYLEGAYKHLKKMESKSITAIRVADSDATDVTNDNTSGLSTNNEGTDNVLYPYDTYYDSNGHYVLYKNLGEANSPFFTGQAKRNDLTDSLKKEIVTLIQESEGKDSFVFKFDQNGDGSSYDNSYVAETREQVVAQRTSLYRYLRFIDADGNRSITKPWSAKITDGASGFGGMLYDSAATVGGWAVGIDTSYIMDGQQGVQSPSDAISGFNRVHEITGVEPLKAIVKNNSYDSSALYVHENGNLLEEVNSVAMLSDEVMQIENMFGNGAGYVGDLIEEKSENSKAVETLLNDVKLRGLGAQTNYNQTFSLEGLNSLAKASSARLFTEKKKLSRAYPTFKLFFIEEDEFESRFINMDDFYSFNGVRSFSVSRSRENAADSAIISLQNIAGTLDGTRKGATIDVDYFSKKRVERIKRENKSSEKKDRNTLVSYSADNSNLESDTDQPFSAVVLRPGMNIQLRAGYSNNPDNLEVLISGRVTDISWGGAGDTCEIVVQSFGTELVQHLKGIEEDSKNKEYFATHQVLGSLMLSPELKHFGRWETGRIFQYGEAQDARLDFFRYKDNSDPSALQGYKQWAGFLSDWGLETAIASVGIGISFLFTKRLGLGKVGLPGFGLRGFTVKAVEGGSKLAPRTAWRLPFSYIRTAVASLMNPRFFPFVSGSLGRLASRVGLNRVGSLMRGGFSTVSGYTALRRGLAQGGDAALGAFKHLFIGIGDDLVRAASSVVKTVAAEVKVLSAATTSLTQTALRKSLLSVETALKAVPRGSSYAVFKTLTKEIDEIFAIIGRTAVSGADDVLANPQLTKRVFDLFKASERFMIAAVSQPSFARSVYLQGFRGAGGSTPLFLGTTALSATFNSTAIFFKTSLFFFAVDYIGGGIFGKSFTDTHKEYRRLYQNWFTKELVYFKLNPSDDNLYPPSPIYYMHNLTHIEKTVSEKVGMLFQMAFSDFSGAEGKSAMEFLKDWQNVNPLLYLKRVHPDACRYKLQNSTIWDVFHEMTLRHPGWIYSAVPYGKEFRYTMFFGIPSQRYWSKPATPGFIQRMNSVRELLTANVDDEDDLKRFFKQGYNEDYKTKKISDAEYEEFKKKARKNLMSKFKGKARNLLAVANQVKTTYNRAEYHAAMSKRKFTDTWNIAIGVYNPDAIVTEADLKDRQNYYETNSWDETGSNLLFLMEEMLKKPKRYSGMSQRELKRKFERMAAKGEARLKLKDKARSIETDIRADETFSDINDRKKLIEFINNRADHRFSTFGSKIENFLADENNVDERYVEGQTISKDDLELNRNTIELRGRLLKEYLTGLENRFVPFRNYHLIRSRENLIRNNFTVSQRNAVNSVNVYYKDMHDANNKKSVFMKASSNIPDSNLISQNVDKYDIRDRAMATRYGIGSLIYGVKEMYSGEISILGDPSVKPWDVCFLFDDQSKMSGPVEVKSVTHIFSFETGYITEIVPNAIVVGNESSSWPVLEALKVYVGGAIARERSVIDRGSSSDASSVNEQYGGDKNLPAILTTSKDKEELDTAIKRMNESTSRELGEIGYGTLGQRLGIIPESPDVSLNIDGFNLSYEASSSMIERYSDLVRNGIIEYKEVVDIDKNIFGETTNTENNVKATVNLEKLFKDLGNQNPSLNSDFSDFQDQAVSTVESLFDLGVSAFFAADALNPTTGTAGQFATKAIGLTGAGLSLLLLGKWKLNAGGLLKAAGVGGSGGVYMAGVDNQYYYNSSQVLDRFSSSYLIAAPIIFSKLLESEAVTIVPIVKEGKPLFAGVSTRSPTSVWQNILGDIVSGIDDAFRGVFDTIDENEAMGTEFYKHIVSRNPERANDPGLKYLKDSGQLLQYIKGN